MVRNFYRRQTPGNHTTLRVVFSQSEFVAKIKEKTNIPLRNVLLVTLRNKLYSGHDDKGGDLYVYQQQQTSQDPYDTPHGIDTCIYIRDYGYNLIDSTSRYLAHYLIPDSGSPIRHMADKVLHGPCGLYVPALQ